MAHLLLAARHRHAPPLHKVRLRKEVRQSDSPQEFRVKRSRGPQAPHPQGPGRLPALCKHTGRALPCVPCCAYSAVFPSSLSPNAQPRKSLDVRGWAVDLSCTAHGSLPRARAAQSKVWKSEVDGSICLKRVGDVKSVKRGAVRSLARHKLQNSGSKLKEQKQSHDLSSDPFDFARTLKLQGMCFAIFAGILASFANLACWNDLRITWLCTGFLGFIR